MAFISGEKHCPVFFFSLGFSSFLRNDVCEKKHAYPRGIFLLNAKQIRNFLCFAEKRNQRRVTLAACCSSRYRYCIHKQEAKRP